MTGYLAKRAGQMALTLFLIVTLTFFLVQAQPGGLRHLLRAEPRPAGRGEGADQGVFRAGQAAVAAVPGPHEEHFHRQLRRILRALSPAGDRGAGGAAAANGGAVPYPPQRCPSTSGSSSAKPSRGVGGGVLEYAATISGATLFTAFTPAFGLMMIWIFAFKLGWLPVGKFLDPLVWRGAEVSANHVFSYMLLTAAAFLFFVFLVVLLFRRAGRIGRSRLAMPLIAAGVVAIPLAWALSDIGFLALDILRHMLLPIVTLTLISFAGTMLLTRNSMLETMREDYVMAARAKGLPEKVVRDRHAARNALLPVVTSLVYSLIFAIDGSVIIEGVFSWPGMGMTLLDAVRSEDLPLVMGSMVFIGLFSLLAHVIVDVLYVYLDPRIRYQ